MKRRFSLLFFFCLLCMVLVGLHNHPAGGKADAPQRVIFNGKNNLFQFTADQNWQDMRGQLHAEAEIEIGNEQLEKYCLVLAEKKEDFTLTLADYTAAVTAQMKNAIQNAAVTEPKKILVNNSNSYVTELSGTVDKINVHYWLYTIENETYYVQAIGWTLKSRVQENRVDINRVLQSWQFHAPSAKPTVIPDVTPDSMPETDLNLSQSA